MKKLVQILFFVFIFFSCDKEEYEPLVFENPEIDLIIPDNFPDLNNSFYGNIPTKYGVELGEKLFSEKRLSIDNTISCASCHIKTNVFSDHNKIAVGVEERLGIRNVPPIQNLAFLQFYNWDGNKLQLENQPLVPIITFEEMDSSILEVIGKIETYEEYLDLFYKAFGDKEITPDRIYKSIAQFEYTLISANSKYDKVMRNEGEVFTENEAKGYQVFKDKCATCHSTELFTDQSFRNIGFPVNPSTDEAGRARVTGLAEDAYRFRVPSLRNVEYTAPYGSFGQFATLKEVLDYLDNGVLESDNLDVILKENNNRIPLTEKEKENLIFFLKALSDNNFIN
ncbi:cytochrome-c peroxidase [Polaribacter sargassicola]|uniref:cytochrome-c peroxidase n=1 Tax=Polaribacter sargassicola TaxID=2836891 RepID=UPI001F15D067|nr:cytochrome-c peroxidase [Polaribacter sp. DS7-9]MCG1035608.1 cytochrome-c peroxidase [Polaribacter sp. DS7-9]